MAQDVSKSSSKLNPWLIIMLTAPIPIILGVLLAVKYYNQASDFTRLTTYFVQRQNTVLAYDAMEVSTGISDLLEKAARDVQMMALLGINLENYVKFYKSQMSDYTQFYSESELPQQMPLPFFNRQIVLTSKGEVVLALLDGKEDKSLKTVKDCQVKNLCDRDLLEKSLTLKPGELWFGRPLRYYTTEEHVDQGASLGVAYHGEKNIFILGIDFRHLRDHLTTPTFPYETKRNLFQAYKNGNYIYIVDSQNNIIAHPKASHQYGINRETGEWQPPMKNDEDRDKHPINIQEYQAGKLKEYFTRLLTRSFTQKGVDIFQAPNLAGANRVISVAPILVSKGQYKATGEFGHVVIGCNVDYFEEPKEKLVPYY